MSLQGEVFAVADVGGEVGRAGPVDESGVEGLQATLVLEENTHRDALDLDIASVPVFGVLAQDEVLIVAMGDQNVGPVGDPMIGPHPGVRELIERAAMHGCEGEESRELDEVWDSDLEIDHESARVGRDDADGIRAGLTAMIGPRAADAGDLGHDECVARLGFRGDGALPRVLEIEGRDWFSVGPPSLLAEVKGVAFPLLGDLIALGHGGNHRTGPDVEGHQAFVGVEDNLGRVRVGHERRIEGEWRDRESHSERLSSNALRWGVLLVDIAEIESSNGSLRAGIGGWLSGLRLWIHRLGRRGWRPRLCRHGRGRRGGGAHGGGCLRRR